jgi:hypothetical protein
MRSTITVLLVLVTLVTTSCTPAFSVRLYNRSDHDIAVAWKSHYETVLPHGKDKIVGSARDYESATSVVVISNDSIITYTGVRNLWDLPKEAMRNMSFPAAAGSHECCLEYGYDDGIYILNVKTLARLNPQPPGFPILPSNKEPNQSLQTTTITVTDAAQPPRQP